MYQYVFYFVPVAFFAGVVVVAAVVAFDTDATFVVFAATVAVVKTDVAIVFAVVATLLLLAVLQCCFCTCFSCGIGIRFLSISSSFFSIFKQGNRLS